MESKLLFLVICLVSYCIFAARKTTAVPDNETLQKLLSLLELPQELERYSDKPSSGLHVESFNFNSCNKSAPLQADVTITPDPIVIPGTVNLGFSGTSDLDVVSPTKAEITVKKKFGVWVEVPCVDNVGSCTYDDFCKVIPFQDESCPPPLTKYGIPCTCPFKKGAYKLPPSPFVVNNTGIPSFLTDGDYRVNVKLFGVNTNQLGCFDIQVSLKSA